MAEMIERTVGSLVELLRRLRIVRSGRITTIVRIGARAELPAQLNPRRMYLIGDPAKWAIFRCPCGRGHDVQLNLAHFGAARWKVRISESGRPSVSPSVDVQDARRCHYWIADGRTKWQGRRLQRRNVLGL